MRIIFLNNWQGQKRQAIRKFLDKESKGTDAFCFLEVSPDFLKELIAFMPNHNSFYEAGRTLALDYRIYGQVIFVGKLFPSCNNVPVQ